jgi:branched-chain amino acid transport system substrate-binding protein
MPRIAATLRRACLFLLLLSFAAVGQDGAILVGVVIPRTGQLDDLGRSYERGLALWAEETNAKGGVLGRRVELRIRDDASDAQNSAPLYEKLLDEDRVNVLMGPVGTAATVPAIAVAEERKRVLVNATGTAASALKRENRYTFQVPAAVSEHGAHIWPLVQHAGAKLPLLIIKDETGVGQRLLDEAERLRLKYFTADIGAGDYERLAIQASAAKVDAVIVVAPPAEAAEVVKAMKKASFAPRIFVASSAMHSEFTRLVGQDAEYAIGVSPYAPAQRTPGNAAFVKAYRAKYKSLPDFFAACGYAAGMLLEAGLREAGAVDQEKLRAALARVRVETPLGAHEAGKDGAQAGARPALLQMQRGRREIVWPEPVATAKAILPFPAWEGRKLLR